MQKLIIGSLTALALAVNVANAETRSIKMGTVAGPETEVMEVAARIAKEEYDLDVEIIEFTDYVTFVYPIGAYSEKYDSIDDLPDGAQIALPNDPSNEGRALILMHNEGLITLNDPEFLESTPIDIAENPRDFRFREIEAAQLPRVLPDVDMAFINNTFAQPAGLSLDDALIKEGPESPYVNLIAVRGGDEEREEIRQLVDAYQRDEVIEKAEELFKGAAVPGWTE